MDVDPLASMRCWALTVELGGRDFEIPALPAVAWWPVLSDGDPGKILDMFVSTESGTADLDAMILDGRITGGELGRMVEDVIEEATGRSLHVALVLATVANAQWSSIGGLLAQTGFRWDVQPIGAALDAIYGVLMANLEEEPRKKLLAVLENESLTTGKINPRQQAQAVADFESMAGPRPDPASLPGRATGAPSGSPRPRTRTPSRPPRQVSRSAAPRKLPGTPG